MPRKPTDPLKACIGSPAYPDCREPFLSRGGPRKRCSTCQDVIAEGRERTRRGAKCSP